MLNRTRMPLNRNETNEFYRKLTVFAAEKLRKKIREEKWLMKEISEELRMPAPRLTEILDFDKYQRPMSRNSFLKLQSWGVLQFSEFRHLLSEREILFYENQGLFLTENLIQLCRGIREKGLDLHKVLSDALAG